MTFKYSNPVVRGNAPDPSAVRVGDDYYLATSSFEYWPGIVIRHSRDLVNWRIIGAAVTRPSQYRRDGKPGGLTLFAPTLRFAEGVFYLTCTNVADGQGNFIVHTTDPSGEWSDALWLDREGFDPSLLFDDGVWYYTRRTLDFTRDDRNLGPIVQAELDMRSGELGPFRELTDNGRGFVTNDIEGPHLYRIGDWYYLSAAEGSSWKGHMQTIGRSRSPWGPFDHAPHNPILSHRDRIAHQVQTVGHAELLDDAQGNWWALALGTRHNRDGRIGYHHNLGRETFLTPVTWKDDWPYVGEQGGTELEFTLDDRTCPPARATFESERNLWTQGWQTLGAPKPELVTNSIESITVPFGSDIRLGAPGAPGALLRTQTEDEQVFAATISNVDADGRAGIAAFSDKNHHFSVDLEQLPAGGVQARFTRTVDDISTSSITALGDPPTIRLGIRCTDLAYVFFAEAGGREIELGSGAARLLSAEASEWFVAVRFALLAIGDTPRSSGGITFTDIEAPVG